MLWYRVPLGSIVCAGLLLGGAGPLVANGLHDVQTMAKASPVEKGVTVSNQEIIAGHGRIRIESAVMVPVRQGDAVVGVYLEGRGHLEYESREPLEFGVMKTNLDWNTKIKPVTAANSLKV